MNMNNIDLIPIKNIGKWVKAKKRSKKSIAYFRMVYFVPMFL